VVEVRDAEEVEVQKFGSIGYIDIFVNKQTCLEKVMF